MLEINVPHFGKLKLQNLVFDFNGTLAVDGKLLPNLKEKMAVFSKKLKIFVVTADTFGSAREELSGLPLTIKILSPQNQTEQKQDFVLELGKEKTIAVGNGNNDALMLKEAKIGIALLQEEGLAGKTLFNANIICRNIDDVFALLENPKRLIATLRS